MLLKANRRSLKNVALLLGIVVSTVGGSRLRAQAIVIRFVDGTSGKPIANQRLLLFLSHKPENAQEYSRAVGTNEHGMAAFDVGDYRFLQVFPDWMTSCISDVNGIALPIEVIVKSGLSAENNCSKKIHIQPKAGELIFYARKMTFLEKMAT